MTFASTPKSRHAKTVAEGWVRAMHARGLSEREIARRGVFSRATVWNVLHPEAGRGGIKEDRAVTIRERLNRNQTMTLLRPRITEPGKGYSVPVEPLNDRERKKIHEHWDALKLAREKGDLSGLRKFRGKTVTVLDRGRRSKLKLMDDRDIVVFKDLQDKNLLAPKGGYTFYDRKKAPDREAKPIVEPGSTAARRQVPLPPEAATKARP